VTTLVNATTTTITKYYFFNGQRVAMRQNGTLTYLHGDHLGSASLATTAIGAQLSTQRYLPYGGTRDGSMPTDRQFTGQRHETSLGFYDYNARQYDPVLGRFLQADSIVPAPGNPQSLNRYAYVLNNPLRYTDPSGHIPDDQLHELLGQYAYLLEFWKMYDPYFYKALFNLEHMETLYATDLPGCSITYYIDSSGNPSLHMIGVDNLWNFQGKGGYIYQNVGVEGMNWAKSEKIYEPFGNLYQQPLFEYRANPYYRGHRSLLAPELIGYNTVGLMTTYEPECGYSDIVSIMQWGVAGGIFAFATGGLSVYTSIVISIGPDYIHEFTDPKQPYTFSTYYLSVDENKSAYYILFSHSYQE